MSNDPNARSTMRDYETELKIAKGLDLICRPPVEASLERLIALKEQVLTLFLRLERGELSSIDAKAQSLRIREELSKVIWNVDDWQMRFAGRN